MSEAPSSSDIVAQLASVISQRHLDMPEGSYVASLLAGGWGATARKVLEEAAETVIAAKEGDSEHLAAEAADLIFHLLITLLLDET